MLYGNINQLGLISYVNPQLVIWIKSALEVADNNELGKFELDERGVFVVLAEAETEPRHIRKAEFHKHFIDIQLVLNGEEVIGFSNHLDEDVKNLSEIENDVMFLDDVKEEQFLYLTDGDFAIFYPDQVHRPLCSFTSPSMVRKAIIKVPKNIFFSTV